MPANGGILDKGPRDCQYCRLGSLIGKRVLQKLVSGFLCRMGGMVGRTMVEIGAEGRIIAVASGEGNIATMGIIGCR